VKVRDVAACQSGDKGDMANVAVFANSPADWELLRARLTVERVRAHFGPLVLGDIHRYELPNLTCLNFVMDRALDGGVSISLRTDPHGKSYRSLMGEIELGET
jgi:hypothetical protein